MKIKPYLYSQPNNLFRTAIEREQKQFIKIAFAVHLSAVISAERYRSDSGALKRAVLSTSVLPCTDIDSKFCLCKTCKLEPSPSMAELIVVYFYILCNIKKGLGFLRAEPLSSNFEDRRGYRGGKKVLSDKSVFPPLKTAPINDEAKKHNENLPGMGGVFNVVNLHVYHYAGNNPVKYTDPDGRLILMLGLSNTAGAGTGVSNNTGVFISILLNGKDISIGSYTIYQTGAYVGLGVSSGIEFTVAPFADEFSDIEGFSLVGGGSFSFWGTAGAGLEVGYNPTAKTFSEKIQSITIAGAFSIGIPGGSPGEAHTWMAYTKKTSELNISKSYREIKQIYKDIQKFLKNEDIDGLVNYLKDKNLLPLEM
ncbi:hypothetical protein [Treponema sp. OMZ 787]|uniref:hypothetical protein n=1 Tax=Treponema sp. OMZ 787 TaxID=2563669 RepID=UPI0020A48556|nr:hypothetical protein [Treponema sp. OMZ 787]